MRKRSKKRGLMTGSAKKRTRKNMEDEGVGGEDRISMLPEPIIHHILSLLPTKCAVSTTVLSKGWNNLWISVPVLDFREWEPPENTLAALFATRSFVEFVDRVLILRQMSVIKKFCLNCPSSYFDDQQIKAWITTAVKCKVEELIVCRRFSTRSDIIPVNLYTCETLSLLDIELCEGTLYLPQKIYFPSLKILRLTGICFRKEQFTQQLFSGCPVLEELYLKNCSWTDLNFISSTLKVLTLESCLGTYSDANAITKIDAPNLLSITVHDGIGKNLVVGSFPSLVHADTSHMYSLEYDGVYAIQDFVKKLSNVKHLKLSGTFFKLLEQAARFPTFVNLITLEVSSIDPWNVRSVFTFLKFSPNLESLVFGPVCCFLGCRTQPCSQICCPDIVNEDALTVDVVPRCLLKHLKLIEFQDFKGKLKELDLVQVFLQNARVLQTVIIEVSSNFLVNNLEKKKYTAQDVRNFKKKTMEQLLKFKASRDCVIKLLLNW